MCVRLVLPIPCPSSLRTLPVTLCMTRDLPVVMYAPRARGGQVSSIFPWRISITCKNGGREGVQIACQIM